MVSSQNITVTLNKREALGKGLGKLRKAGHVPAVIHSPGKESIHVSGSYTELIKLYQVAGKHHPIDVQIGDQKLLTIIKEVNFEPRKNMLQHIVFGEIKQNVKVETDIPLVFGEGSPAERAGLLVLTQIDHVEVSAFPRDLPNEIVVNVENLLAVGDRILVSDLPLPSGVEVLSDADQVVAAVEEHTASAEPEEAAQDVVAETPAAEATE